MQLENLKHFVPGYVCLENLSTLSQFHHICRFDYKMAPVLSQAIEKYVI